MGHKIFEKSVGAIFPKGGEWKSTFIQTVSTSKVFKNFSKTILEADSQNSISDWVNERESKKSLDVDIIKFNDTTKDMGRVFNKYKKGKNLLFVDFPGESVSAKLTRSGLGYCDLVIIPLSPRDKAIRAFENNLLPMLAEFVSQRGKSPFYLLPTFAHHNANAERYREIYMPYEEYVNILHNIHRDRPVLTYFSAEGRTLEEYAKSVKTDKAEYTKVQKAIKEVDNIASEIKSILESL